MRLIAFAALLGLAACESNDHVIQTNVVWMDWPAEVPANDPFRTRLVVWQPCAIIRGFVPSVTAQTTTVTFAPYFLVDKDPIYCAGGLGVTSEFDFTVNVPLDTAGTAPGLMFERVYEMRAATPPCALCASLNSVPWLSFGYVTVRAAQPSPAVARNAAGSALAERDSAGCTRIRPYGLGPSAALVVENPPDTIPPVAFVYGYIHQPAAPVCGETTVFHMTGQYTGG